MEKGEVQRIVNEKLSKRTNEEFVSLFDEANDPETTAARVQEIVSEITQYVPFMLVPVAQHHFFRSRYWGTQDKYPGYISELLEPEPGKATQQRCNIENKPVLYVSSHPRALIAECHYKCGDIYTMVQFDRALIKEDLSCLMLGMDAHQVFQGSPAMENMMEFKKEFYGDNFLKYQFIERLLNRQFVRDDDPKGITYRFTANLCEKYFSASAELDAIVYPSIATQGAVHNLAIRPNTFYKTYQARKAGIFEVLSDHGSRQLAGARINADGKLDWSIFHTFDKPKPVGVRAIDPDDPRIYIAPWK